MRATVTPLRASLRCTARDHRGAREREIDVPVTVKEAKLGRVGLVDCGHGPAAGRAQERRRRPARGRDRGEWTSGGRAGMRKGVWLRRSQRLDGVEEEVRRRMSRWTGERSKCWSSPGKGGGGTEKDEGTVEGGGDVEKRVRPARKGEGARREHDDKREEKVWTGERSSGSVRGVAEGRRLVLSSGRGWRRRGG